MIHEKDSALIWTVLAQEVKGSVAKWQTAGARDRGSLQGEARRPQGGTKWQTPQTADVMAVSPRTMDDF